MPRALLLLLACALGPGAVAADLAPGLLSDFDDGTLQGWSTSKDNSSNPGDYLVVAPAPRLSIRTDAFNGVVSPWSPRSRWTCAVRRASPTSRCASS